MSNFLLYTYVLISQKINFATEVRFSQKRSHIIMSDYYCCTKSDIISNKCSAGKLTNNNVQD